MDVSKNLNPFLFDEPTSPAENSDPAKNPFLIEESYNYDSVPYSSINPFSDNITESVNIFASSETYSSEINPFGEISKQNVNIFSQQDTDTVNSQFDIFGSSVQPDNIEETLFGNTLTQATRPPRPPSPRDLLSGSPQHTDSSISPGRPPPPRPPPPSKETKDLLQTVIGAIEATTDTLQEKLNTTKTPCPSPCSGGQHSRSPTPDIQITAPEKESDSFSTVFGQTIELSDTETDEAQEISSTVKETTDECQSNEIDLFGDIVSHSKPRTTQDILSLYNKPSESDKQQIDLLSGDLIGDSNLPDEEIKDKLIETSLENVNISININKPNFEDRDSEQPIALYQNGSQLEQGNRETGTSPEQISDKSGSEPTVIETDIFGNSAKGDESAIISDNNTGQSTFMPIEVIEGFDVEGCLSTTEYQSADIPSTIFSTGSTPPSNEFDHIRKDSVETFPEYISPRKESMEDIALRNESMGPCYGEVNSTEQSTGSYTEQLTNRKESITSNNESFTPRGVSVEHMIEQEIPRKESIGLNAESLTPKRESIEPISDLVTPKQEPIGSNNKDTASSKENEYINDSSGSFTKEIDHIPSNDFNSEVGIADRNDSYTHDSVQWAESKEAISTNMFDSKKETTTPETIFGDFPSDIIQPPTKGFSIFGDIPSNKPISGSESTGAALFETEAPAPNVGMSLFGAGQEATLDIFAESKSNTMVNPFAPVQPIPTKSIVPHLDSQKQEMKQATEEEFDEFSARFDNVTYSNLETAETSFDPFTSSNREATSSPWGDQMTEGKGDGFGFDDNAKFDSFLSLHEPPLPPKRRHAQKQKSADSDEEQMNIVIRPIAGNTAQFPSSSPVPVLAPPPAVVQSAFADSTPRFNPFDRNDALPGITTIGENEKGPFERSDSQETPPTPLFEEDQSVPLEDYPRTLYDGRTWEMYLRQPNKKKITGQRFWKKIYLKINTEGALQLYNNKDDKEPFQELPLQPCYSVSDIGAQQFDQFGKIFTIKVQYIFYKERPGVRPGQISKAERITTKLSKFAQYAIAGDYEGVKEFASDVRKLGMPVEHAPQISQLLKLGTQNYEELKLFSSIVEEFMFKLVSTRERALNYKMEEVQLTAVDETFVEQDLRGAVIQMVARVRIFFLAFLSGMSEVDLGINDLRKQGHEVVGRHDIIPVVTEEWIRLEDIEFHCTVDKEEFDKTRHIRFSPPDASYIELMRYRVRPPKNRELPLQVKTKFIMKGKQVDIQCEILVPGFSGRKLGQVPCEDVSVRFPLPECWIYMFRVEKHFRYGSVKSAHRRTGKVKGMERFKGTVESAESALMEVTSGQAKYEHQHRAIVWRMSRLPKEGQGAYSVHQFTCKMHLTSYDQIPENFDRHCIVEFTMPATTVSHCVMRSVSVSSDDPPEKYVRYLARHEYKVEIEFTSGSGPSDYIAATKIEPEHKEERIMEPVGEESSSDESS